MSKIADLQECKKIIFIARKTKKKIVVCGGCFDILHIGHVKFLQEAKKTGSILIVLLESDENVKRLKGINRPIFNQKERAIVLSSLNCVDYVILLPFMSKNSDYDKLVLQLKPDVIAVTENDPLILQKKSQAKSVYGKIGIIPKIRTFSSSKLAKLLGIG